MMRVLPTRAHGPFACALACFAALLLCMTVLPSMAYADEDLEGMEGADSQPMATDDVDASLVAEEQDDSSDTSNEAAPLEEGTYVISSGVKVHQVLDVAAGSQENGANVQLYESNMTDAQSWNVSCDAQGYYTLENVGSGKVLDVAAGKAQSGVNVQQYEANGTPAQKWTIKADGDGFVIASALDEGLVLDVAGGSSSNGTNVQIYAANGTAAQRFYFFLTNPAVDASETTIDDGVYLVESACGDAVMLEVGGGSALVGASVNVYADNSTPAQRWRIEADGSGFYVFTNVNSGLVLDVSGANVAPATKVWQYESNASDAQKWAISDAGDGLVKIVNKATALVLDLSGANTSNGTVVVGYMDNATAAQRWRLVSCKTIEDGIYVALSGVDQDKALDVANGSKSSGANVQIYAANGTDAQRFRFLYSTDTGYYTITSVLAGMALDVRGAGVANGTNAQVYSLNASLAQMWDVRADGGGVVLMSALGTNALDVTSASSANGTNVQLYRRNRTAAQRWILQSQLVVSLKGENSEVIQGTYNNNVLSLFIPSYMDTANAVVSFSGVASESILLQRALDGELTIVQQGMVFDFASYVDADESGAHLLYVSVQEADGSMRTQQLCIYKSANVSSVFLISDDPQNKGRGYIESSAGHSTKATGSMLMVSEDGTIIYDGALTQIKGRGNSTWWAVKKPYQIKLKKKTDLLSTGLSEEANKTWVLLANDYDPTLLHNQIAYDLAREMGLSNSPYCELVDLWYDGEYRGSYLLCEKTEINSGRVDVDESDGGWLAEFDQAYWGDEDSSVVFDTSIGHFVIKNNEVTIEQRDAIQAQVQDALDRLAEGDGSGFDMASAACMALVNEFFGNADYLAHSSTYFYSFSADGQIYAGPVWDFDGAFGLQISQSTPYGYCVYDLAPYRYNDAFVEATQSLVGSFCDCVEILLGGEDARGTYLCSVDYYVNKLEASQQMNAVLWGLGASADWLVNIYDTYEENISYMKDYLSARAEWLLAEIASW